MQIEGQMQRTSLTVRPSKTFESIILSRRRDEEEFAAIKALVVECGDSGLVGLVTGEGIYAWDLKFQRHSFLKMDGGHTNSQFSGSKRLKFLIQTSGHEAIYLAIGGQIFLWSLANDRNECLGTLPLMRNEYATFLDVAGRSVLVAGTSTGRLFTIRGLGSEISVQELSKGWSLYESANWVLNRGVFQDAVKAIVCFERNIYVASKSSLSMWSFAVNSSTASFGWQDQFPTLLQSIQQEQKDVRSIEFLDLAFTSEIITLVGASTPTHMHYYVALATKLKNQGLACKTKQLVHSCELSNLPEFHGCHTSLNVIERGETMLVSVSGLNWLATLEEAGEGFVGGIPNQSDYLLLGGGIIQTQSSARPPMLVLMKSNCKDKHNMVTAIFGGDTKIVPIQKPQAHNSGQRIETVEDDVGETKTEAKSEAANVRQALLLFCKQYTGEDFGRRNLDLAGTNPREWDASIRKLSDDIINQMPSSSVQPLTYESTLVSQMLRVKEARHRALVAMAYKKTPLSTALKVESKAVVAENGELAFAALEMKRMLTNRHAMMSNSDYIQRRHKILYHAMKQTVEEVIAIEGKSSSGRNFRESCQGLTVPEIFFSYAHCLKLFFAKLLKGTYDFTHVKIVSEVLDNVLTSALQYRANPFQKSKRGYLDTSIKNRERWTFSKSIRDLIAKIVRTVENLLSAEDRPEQSTELYQMVDRLGTKLLDGYCEHILLADDPLKECYEKEFTKQRAMVISVLSRNKSFKDILRTMAEKFEDFDHLIKCCEECPPFKRNQALVHYGKKFGPGSKWIVRGSSFGKSVFEYYSKLERPTSRLLELASLEGFSTVFQRYLQNPEYSWLHAIGEKRFQKCEQILRQQAPRETGLRKRKHLVSICKLAVLASGACSTDADDRHLTFLRAHEKLSEAEGKRIVNVLKPSELIDRLAGALRQLSESMDEKKTVSKKARQLQLDIAPIALQVFDSEYGSRLSTESECKQKLKLVWDAALYSSLGWLREKERGRERMEVGGDLPEGISATTIGSLMTVSSSQQQKYLQAFKNFVSADKTLSAEKKHLVKVVLGSRSAMH